MDRSPEYACRLLDKARGDQFALEQLAALSEAPVWLLGFHAQQAVEKAIKAVLASRSIEYPSTHNLASLAALLSDHGIPLPPDAGGMFLLTSFGVAFRYDTDQGDEGNPPLDRAWARSLSE